MQTITFDTDKLEQAISVEFGCRVSEIVSLRDSLVKKVIVFILSKAQNYNARAIATKYSISYLYVPTVILEVEFLMKTKPDFENKINSIIQNVYEVEKMD
ncbi:hypothetical protein [Flavobacterium aquiphilum]|uniref:hypothetical protein n=1 Tax=Flavobacterium aquiphilum TaxID=3003261 RepID=UPI00247FEDDB|nr:hypothetical protein [Flavobacterium aquiphilum]